MHDKDVEFSDLVEFIHYQYGIELQPYQIAYLKYLLNEDNYVHVSGRNSGKTFLLEKYMEFKKKYEKTPNKPIRSFHSQRITLDDFPIVSDDSNDQV